MFSICAGFVLGDLCSLCLGHAELIKCRAFWKSIVSSEKTIRVSANDYSVRPETQTWEYLRGCYDSFGNTRLICVTTGASKGGASADKRREGNDVKRANMPLTRVSHYLPLRRDERETREEEMRPYAMTG